MLWWQTIQNFLVTLSSLKVQVTHHVVAQPLRPFDLGAPASHYFCLLSVWWELNPSAQKWCMLLSLHSSLAQISQMAMFNFTRSLSFIFLGMKREWETLVSLTNVPGSNIVVVRIWFNFFFRGNLFYSPLDEHCIEYKWNLASLM